MENLLKIVDKVLKNRNVPIPPKTKKTREEVLKGIEKHEEEEK
jgi:hypothetical protein